MPDEWKVGVGLAAGGFAPVGVDLVMKGRRIPQLGNVKVATMFGVGAGVPLIAISAGAPATWGLKAEDRMAMAIGGGALIATGGLVNFLPAPATKYRLSMTPEQRAALGQKVGVEQPRGVAVTRRII